MEEHVFYRADELDTVLARMARGLRALVGDPARLTLVGILRRGAPLADRLGAHLLDAWGVERIARFDLDIKRYADDLTLLHPQTQLRESATAVPDLAGRSVVLVDDVLYEGHSLLRALCWLAGRGAAEIRTAVLVDRRCARLPLKADVAGLVLEVAPLQIVDVQVPPYEPQFAIHVKRREKEHVQQP